jgi:CII-binding regulator of phage lambda lysogenization HflD
MGDLDRLKQDVQEGRIDSDRLVDLIVTLQRQLQAAHQRIDEQAQRIEALEKQLGGAAGRTHLRIHILKELWQVVLDDFRPGRKEFPWRSWRASLSKGLRPLSIRGGNA